MPLHSKLFHGDPKLEACLIHDSAHVTQGAVGKHVAKIQFALATLDNLGIAQPDLSTETYGASTADAVLAYKTRRHIINRSYQTRPDSIVGKMTIAALDKEMFSREHQPSLCESRCRPMTQTRQSVVRQKPCADLDHHYRSFSTGELQ